MPIPRPKKNEKKSKFIARCMSSKVMKEYRKINQRIAICNSSWNRKK